MQADGFDLAMMHPGEARGTVPSVPASVKASSSSFNGGVDGSLDGDEKAKKDGPLFHGCRRDGTIPGHTRIDHC